MEADPGKYFSQHGEDTALAEYFGRRRDGFFVEVGALDGVTLSNTYYFERELGWRGILVEANPVEAERCAAARPRSVVVQAAVVDPEGAREGTTFQVVEGEAGLSSLQLRPRYRELVARLAQARGHPLNVMTIEVPTTTLDAILAQHAPPEIDFMTIDIEGHEGSALRGLSLGQRWRPRVLLVESTTVWPEFSVLSMMIRGGYAYRRTIVINDWYEPASLLARLWSVPMIYANRVPRATRLVAKVLLRRIGLLTYARALRSKQQRR